MTSIQFDNWSGSIPVVLSLAPTSLSAPSMPAPIHVMVSRQSYLHVSLQSAVLRLYKFAPMSFFFSSSGRMMIRSEPAPGEATEEAEDSKEATTESSKPAARSNSTSTDYPVCWFEDEDTQTALRWHLFAGVLWDMKRNYNTKTIPWKIRLHFTAYPSSQILPLDNGAVLMTIVRTFKNSLKQALVLQYGNNKAALNMNKQSYERIWDAIVTSNYVLYQSVNDDLPNQKDLNLLPVRVLLNSKPPIQWPVSLKEASSTTLGSLLLDWLPDMFEKDDTTIQPASPEMTQLTVQGVEVPLSSPLMDLWKGLAHPDHFLYVCIVTR